MTRIDYIFADGTFQRIRLARLPPKVAKELRKLERRKERALERDCTYLDVDGYTEGDSETHVREISYSDPVADAADTNALESAVRDAVNTLHPVQQHRVWLYAQGYTYAEIAAMEGVSDAAVRKAIKLAKKKIKKVLENGFGFGANLWGIK